MGTDVKIGIAVGAVVLLVVVGYFGYKAVGPGEQPAAKAPAVATSPAGTVARVNVRPPRRTETIAPAPAPAPSPATEGQAREPLPPNIPTRPVLRPMPAPGEQPPEATVEVGLVNKPGPTGVEPGGTPAAAVTPQRPSLTASAGKDYMAKDGDTFGSIAQEAYGDAKYANLVKQANPAVVGDRPRAGLVLKIPALASAGSSAGVSGRLPAGSREYIVEKGDQGFWNIAQKVYGSGLQWTLIAKANPGCDSNNLKVGQKLTIPPAEIGNAPAKPAAPAPGPASAPVAPTPAASLKAGGTYTVKQGDTGLWGIAQTVYGDGQYYTLIEAANPAEDSKRLRVGQKLVIPPLTESSKASVSAPRPAAVSTPARGGSGTAKPAAATDGKPVFD